MGDNDALASAERPESPALLNMNLILDDTSGNWALQILPIWMIGLTVINGETGVSMIVLNTFGAGERRAYNYWMAFVAMVARLALVFVFLRLRFGAAVQAIRDDEEAAQSVGVRVLASKRTIFSLAAFGRELAGPSGWRPRSHSSRARISAFSGLLT